MAGLSHLYRNMTSSSSSSSQWSGAYADPLSLITYPYMAWCLRLIALCIASQWSGAYADPALDGPNGWSAGADAVDFGDEHWVWMDTGAVQDIRGVVTQVLASLEQRKNKRSLTRRALDLKAVS